MNSVFDIINFYLSVYPFCGFIMMWANGHKSHNNMVEYNNILTHWPLGDSK